MKYEDTTDYFFFLQCLQQHNLYRHRHGSPPLRYDTKVNEPSTSFVDPNFELYWINLSFVCFVEKLIAFARKRAKELAREDGDNWGHPDDLIYGENLAWHSQSYVDCQDSIDLWYNEISLYDYDHPNITAENGHFTQVVWRQTYKLGCGRAVSHGKVGGTYIVCNYDPPGNILEEEEENIWPPEDVLEAEKRNKKDKVKKVVDIDKVKKVVDVLGIEKEDKIDKDKKVEDELKKVFEKVNVEKEDKVSDSLVKKVIREVMVKIEEVVTKLINKPEWEKGREVDKINCFQKNFPKLSVFKCTHWHFSLKNIWNYFICTMLLNSSLIVKILYSFTL